jgi:nucleotide-binding universal stress UspA family protein
MTRTVAVGVGGAGGGHALAWAGEQALRTASRLVLLHACPPSSPLTQQPGTPPMAQLELVDPPLARAVCAARSKLGSHNVSLRILQGDPGVALVEASVDAAMLVIGTGGGGATVRRVIRHARCPVIVARPDHDGHDFSFAGQVVVGVDANAAGRAAVEYAFAYADQHRLPVTAVRVTDADRSAALSRSGDLAAAVALLRAEVQAWRQKYPQVRVRSTVLHGAVGRSLTWAGSGADLLVIGNRRRGPLGRSYTGDVPQTVARRARCPVAVVPARRRSEL